jgi:hypothetical protein
VGKAMPYSAEKIEYVSDIKRTCFKFFAINFRQEKNSLSYAEFHALFNDILGKKFCAFFNVESEACFTKTEVFYIKRYFEHL